MSIKFRKIVTSCLAGRVSPCHRLLVRLAMVVLSGGTVACCSADEKPLRLWQFREMHLSVPVELRVYAAEEASANTAARAAYDRIDQLNALFSDYDADSEAMRLCRAQGPTKVSPELFFLLTKSVDFSQKSDNAFDVTVGPLIKQWRRARRQKALPSAENLSAAKAVVGIQYLEFDPTHQTVTVLKPGLQLDFGGIAKGYIAEEAFRVLEERGCSRSLVAIAGDMFAGDPPPDAVGWKVGIAPLDRPDGAPSRFLALKRQAVSTSGDAFQHTEINGVRYSHIVDPQTGIGLTHRSSVTVVSPQGWQADAAATAVCILGPKKGLEFLAEFPETEGLIMTRDQNEEMRIEESPGFKTLEPPGQ